MPTAIITGGAVRIGRALAFHLADKGYQIALHYHRSVKDAEETLDRAREKGVRCEGYPCDLRDLEAVENLIGRVTADFSDVELLINAAANFIHANVEETTPDILSDSLHVNLMAPFLLMKEYKRRVNRGLIVNFVDERILRRVPAFAAYSVGKIGLSHLTHLAAIEWGETVRVNAIAPGLILPPVGGAPDYLERAAKNIPVRAHGSVADILRGLDYLLESPFVNGETLFIDGGESKA